MAYDLATDPAFDFPSRTPEWRFLILSLPRSGSSLLADGLFQTGLAGAPFEYFNEIASNGVATFSDTQAVQDYLEPFQQRRTSPNGAFGIKVHYYQFAAIFTTEAGVTETGRAFLRSFDRIIMIDRQDKIRQAISLLVASNTDKWSSEDEADSNKSHVATDEQTMLQVANRVAFLLSDLIACKAMVRKENLTVLESNYEDLVENYDAEMRKVLDFLSLPYVQTSLRSVQLSGPESDKAKAHFLSMIGG